MENKVVRSGIWAVLILISLGLVIIFQEVFFMGQVQVPADIVLFDPVLSEARPPGLTNAQNYLLADHIYQFYTWHYLAAESMQNTGQIPLWNPHMLAGHPLMANAQPALYYPINWLLFCFNPGVVATIRVFFNILVAGFFTYLFCRMLLISQMGAILAAIAFAFSGSVMVGPGHAYANSLVWLPFIMWAGEKILAGHRIYGWGLVAGIGLALSVLGGHPETAFHNGLIFGLYILARLLFLKVSFTEKLRLISAFILAGFVGFLLGAVQLFPFADALSQGVTVSRSRSWGVDSVYYSREWLANFATLLTLFFPNFFGHPAENTYFWPFSNYQNFLEQSMYFGLIPLALAVGAIFGRQKNRVVVVIIAVLAIMVLAIALRLPGFEAVNYLPLLSRVNNTRFKWTFTFLAVILAGFGFDAIKQYILSEGTKNKSAFRWTVFVILIAFAMLLIIAVWKYVITAIQPIPVDSFSYHLLFAVFSLRQSKTLVSVGVIIATLGIFWYFRNKPGRLSLLSVALITLTFIELVTMARGYNTTVSPNYILPEVRLTRRLQDDSDLFRIMSADGTFWPNYGAVYGLSYVGGYDLPGFKRYGDIYQAQGGEGYSQLWKPDWPLVDWMNIKYVISATEQNLKKLELVYAADGYFLYQNRQVLPRAYMVYQTDVVENEQNVLQMMINGEYDFANRVILETDLPAKEAIKISSPELEAQVESIAYNNDDVTFRVSTETPGILVMSDLYTPGWKVIVDEQPAELHRANYTFRAVFVPAGEHTVTFYYQPFSFQLGWVLSILGLVILVIGSVGFYLRRKGDARDEQIN